MNLDGFINGEYAINCETEEESIELLNKLDKLDIKWIDDSRLNSRTCYKYYLNKTCYDVIDKKHLMFCETEYYEKNNIKIIKFSELKGVDGMFKVGDRVGIKKACKYRFDEISIDKVYQVLEIEIKARSDRNTITIRDDNGNSSEYCASYFILADKQTDILKSCGDCELLTTCGTIDMTGKIPYEPCHKDTFQPTKSFLMEHKDEYVARFRSSDQFVRQCKYMPNWNTINEDLTTNDPDDDDIVELWVKVWQRDTRRELTIEEVENEFNIKVKRESVK